MDATPNIYYIFKISYLKFYLYNLFYSIFFRCIIESWRGWKCVGKGNILGITLGIILFFIVFISFIYIIVGVIFLLPYLKIFLNGGYLIQTEDLPNYSNLFDSIFSVVGILSSSILGVLVYKITKTQAKISQNQMNIQYNNEISGSAEIIYTAIKYKILNDLSNFFKQNKDAFESQKYMSVSLREEDAKEVLANTSIGNLSIIENKFETLQRVISNMNNKREKTHLIAMLEDMNRDNTVLYIFMKHIIHFDENGFILLNVVNPHFPDDTPNMSNNSI